MNANQGWQKSVELFQTYPVGLQPPGRQSDHGHHHGHDVARADAGTIAIPLEERLRGREVEEIADFLEAPTPPMPAYDLDAVSRRDLAIYLLESTR